jgi:polyribonucleotide nucleotidyltransferase
VDGQFVVNPTMTQLLTSDLELVVCSVDEDVVMIEASASEAPEDVVLEGIRFARKYSREVSDLIRQLVKIAGKPKTPVAPAPASYAAIEDFIRSKYSSRVDEALNGAHKMARGHAITAVRDEAAKAAVEKGLAKAVQETFAPFDDVLGEIVRRRILAGRRSDGRAAQDLRLVTGEVGVLPRTHGSALFTRGETQALVTVTLGTSIDEEMVESLGEDFTRKFMLHYNFPPFSVGEVKPVRGPSRRDIGHGALAEKAVEHVLPGQEVFPYTIRVVSDIMESNGSSSMATVCGATLSLMDAGVPITRPVAGISIGLVKEGDRAVLLTDIQGEEDHFGDMDFKVAGTQNGITAIQLDMKISGLSDELIAGALEQAREARISILRSMLSAIARPRPEISTYAPKLIKLKIDPDKIGMVIGSGGKVVRKLQEESGATIELEDDGTVTISAPDREAIERARDAVLAIVEEIEVGKTYNGTVRGIKDFGAFVEVLPGQEGLVHISELDDGYVAKVTDIVRLGDKITVKCIGIDDQGKVRLSRKAVIRDEKSQ